MLRRWHILLLILVTLTAFCGLAAAKLRGTPKYDRVRVGMSLRDACNVLGIGDPWTPVSGITMPDKDRYRWHCDEGTIVMELQFDPAPADANEPAELLVVSKEVIRRGPLERLAWLAGWR